MVEVKQRVSVRTLVEFVLRHGDLQSGVIGGSRAVDGIRAHQFVQKNRGDDYQPELTLQTTYTHEGFTLEIHGRADGLFKKESGFCVEEIKSTSMDLDLIDESFSLLHWAQAQCYAYILAQQENFEQIEVQLTYIQLDSQEIKSFSKSFQIDDLGVFFRSLVQRYLAWACRLNEWSNLRNTSIRNLEFPYPFYRPGQRELVVATYKTIKEGKRLFVQAPTGIGKTFGTIFPALKALVDGFPTPIFYLTAKTITRTVVEKSLDTLQGQGLAIKRLTLTAKDKVCLCPENSCKPDDCSYAKGYYDRVKAAIENIFDRPTWDRENIVQIAREYTICPFELSLDLANWSDFIICDYNYLFDPRVYLKRFFLEDGEYIFLVDEAHNLVDRAREMFSAELKKEDILDLKREVQKEEPLLAKRLQTVNNHLIKLRKQGLRVEKAAPKSLYSSLEKFLREAENIFKKEDLPTWHEKLTEQYFIILGFLRTAESYDEHYVTYYKDSEQDFTMKLFCVDPSKRLAEGLNRGRAAILFSATLSPLEYFIQILGGESSSYKLKLESPFSSDNLCLFIHKRISTKYKHRASTITQVAEGIASIVQAKIGNYLVYFPSYEYLKDVYQTFSELCPGTRVILQTMGMAEEAREEFLDAFESDPDEILIGFALMGGIFGEGVDLTGNRLSGAIIVGVGLPQIGMEREIIRTYFEESHQLGFEFAYMYPGMNKVLQAVGRVIRTEKDRGVVLLIDERFSLASYKRLFPKEWKQVHYIEETKKIQPTLDLFWSQNH